MPKSQMFQAAFGIGFLVGLLTLCGCSSDKASASGEVRYKGKLVKGGSLVFSGPDGVAIVTNIDPEGTYSVSGVKPGKVKVGLNGASPSEGGRSGREAGGRGSPPPPASSAAKNDPDAVVIPKELGSPESSGITIELKPGSNSVNITVD